MDKKAVKQSTMIYVLGGITVLLSAIMFILSVKALKGYEPGYVSLTLLFSLLLFACAIINIAYLYKKMIRPIHSLTNVANALAEGDTAHHADVPADTSEIGQLAGSIMKTRDNFDALVADTQLILKSAKEGKLDARAEASRHKGNYRLILEEMNQTLDAMAAPIQEAIDVLDKISLNDFSSKMEGEYKGQLSELSKSINTVRDRLISVVNGFIRISNGDTSELENFIKIGKRCENDSLIPAVISTMKAIRDVTDEVKKITQECANGNIMNARGNVDRFNGGYREIIEGINHMLDAVLEPCNETIRIMKVMASNDFTMSMSSKYKGEFAVLSESINNVQSRLLSIQNIAVNISQGDFSELENLRREGKKSENDRLSPALIGMMETILNLIEETKTLAHAAAEGNLQIRGDTSKFKGEYVSIIRGINDVIDSAAAPLEEIKDVMLEISEGNMNVSVKGNYKGDYLVLANSVNDTATKLRAVVDEISSTLSRMAQNDLNIDKVRSYSGNFVLISQSLNKIIDSLNGTMRAIHSAADQVAAGAGQVAAASQSLSQGSEEQASSVEEVTASIAEMTEEVKQSAAKANQAAELGLAAKNDAIKGNDQMKEMLQAMRDINEASNNISKIIKVIDDIAFQTNILALNAAVEAARAGQYGKGFAVVAEEVRNLAQRSANAAKETTDLIEGSIEKVNTGTVIANNTAQALNQIMESVSKASELVSQISSASNRQASAIAQINQAVEQVSQVVQTNSATAEESASASEELSSQADMLKQMVNRFKLRDEKSMFIPDSERMSPSVLRAIEEMIQKEDRMQASRKAVQKEGVDTSSARETDASGNKPKISLDDKEFGKY